jgi:hypothetical protein
MQQIRGKFHREGDFACNLLPKPVGGRQTGLDYA